YLWLPVSDLFSTVLARLQSLMLQADIDRMQADPNFSLDNSDVIYIVFLVIGIIGYFTIPTVAGWIISAGGMGNFGRNVNNMATKSAAMAGGFGGAVAGNIAGRLKGNGNSGSSSSSTGSSNRPQGRNYSTGNGGQSGSSKRTSQ
ncbi:MAG: hypothetical protein ACK5M3_12105, partial [Dysgonomonas sp.]